MSVQQTQHLPGPVQRLFRTENPIVFRIGIDEKCLSVCALFQLRRLPPTGHRPIDTAIKFIPKMGLDVPEGALGKFLAGRVPHHIPCSAVGP